MSALAPGFSNTCLAFSLHLEPAKKLIPGDWRSFGYQERQKDSGSEDDSEQEGDSEQEDDSEQEESESEPPKDSARSTRKAGMKPPKKNTYLYARPPDDPTVHVRINLDDVLGNHRGRFVWREGGMFTDSSDVGKSKLVTRLVYVDHAGKEVYHTELHTRLQLPDGSWSEAHIDLDEHIYYDVEKKALMPHKMPRAHTVCLLLDGTGNEYDDTNTNVVFLTEALHKSDPSIQHVYYQDGLGTYTSTGFWTRAGSAIAKTADQAVAWGLDDHVMSAYKFLMNAYRPGSKICVFGFSRGAHTARAVVAMVNAVGLLPPHNAEHVPFAFACYKNSANPQSGGPKRCREFLRTFSEEVSVHFVGLWDTVNSTGALWPRVLPGTDLNPECRFFRHALALDERRVRFKPTIGLSRPEELQGDIPRVKQVWFAGNHCDVGGGNRPDIEGLATSNVPLRWMIQETSACKTDLLFKATASDHKVGLKKLLKLARTRQSLIDACATTPFNDLPSNIKLSNKLATWPRAHITVDQESGEARIGTKNAHCNKHDNLDMYDMLATIRHDNIRDPKWIFMEYTPTVVFSALKRNPKSIDKYNKKYDTLNVPQKWEVIINKCSGRDIWPEADNKFHLHESLNYLDLPLPEPTSQANENIDHSPIDTTDHSPIDTTDSSPLLPESSQPSTSLSWPAWFWAKLGYPAKPAPKQSYLCRGRFHLPSKEVVDLKRLLELHDNELQEKGSEGGLIVWIP